MSNPKLRTEYRVAELSWNGRGLVKWSTSVSYPYQLLSDAVALFITLRDEGKNVQLQKVIITENIEALETALYGE